MSEEEMKTFSNERKLSCSTVTRSSLQQGYFKKNGYKKLYKQEGSDFFFKGRILKHQEDNKNKPKKKRIKTIAITCPEFSKPRRMLTAKNCLI